MSAANRSRREILAAAAGVSAALVQPALGRGADKPAAQPRFHRAPSSSPPRFKISVAGYSFRDSLDRPGKPGKMSLLDLVDLGARLGLDAVEPTSYYFLRDDDEFIYTLKRRAFLAGLTISGTPVGNNFVLPPGPQLDEQIALVKKWVDVCVKLGSPVIRIFAGRKPTNGDREQHLAYVVTAAKEACAYAGSRGIFLALENHGYLTESADDLLKILDGVKSEWLGINLDTGNFPRDPYENIAKAATRAVVCQVKTEVAKKNAEGREPADFARIIRTLRQANYRGYVTLEYEGPDPHRQVPYYVRTLQELAG